MESVLVKVDWLHPSQGGRQVLPDGKHFVAVGKFPHQSYQDWLKSAWSLQLNWLDKDNPGSWYGLAHFVSPEGPTGWLTPGGYFDIFEGPKKVALVSVVTTAKAIDSLRKIATAG